MVGAASTQSCCLLNDRDGCTACRVFKEFSERNTDAAVGVAAVHTLAQIIDLSNGTASLQFRAACESDNRRSDDDDGCHGRTE